MKYTRQTLILIVVFSGTLILYMLLAASQPLSIVHHAQHLVHRLGPGISFVIEEHLPRPEVVIQDAERLHCSTCGAHHGWAREPVMEWDAEDPR